MDPDWLVVVAEVLEVLVRHLGPNGTTLLFVVVILLAFVYRAYQMKRRDLWAERAIAGRDETIRRLAQSDREWRVYFLVREGGMSLNDAEALVSGPEDEPMARLSTQKAKKEDT